MTHSFIHPHLSHPPPFRYIDSGNIINECFVGIEDPQALTMAMSAMQACQLIGMPECGLFLAHVATHLSRFVNNTIFGSFYLFKNVFFTLVYAPEKINKNI